MGKPKASKSDKEESTVETAHINRCGVFYPLTRVAFGILILIVIMLNITQGNGNDDLVDKNDNDDNGTTPAPNNGNGIFYWVWTIVSVALGGIAVIMESFLCTMVFVVMAVLMTYVLGWIWYSMYAMYLIFGTGVIYISMLYFNGNTNANGFM